MTEGKCSGCMMNTICTYYDKLAKKETGNCPVHETELDTTANEQENKHGKP